MAVKRRAKKVADLTVEEFVRLVKQIVHEELKGTCTVDEEGNLVFRDEESYARYLELTGKRPSEVKAYWIDEHGLKVRYSDDEVTPELMREIEEAKREAEEKGTIPYEQVRKELGL